VPIFEFKCKKCGHAFEELLSLSELDSGKLSCPACSSKRIEKGFSAFATGTAGQTAGGNPGGSFGSGGGCGPGGFT